MKKKKAIIIVSSLLVFVTGILATIIIIDTKKEFKTEFVENLPDDALAIMIENSDGSYTQSSSTDLVPTGYTLNTTKSYCINGGKVIHDKVNNKIKAQVKGADKCYIYLDLGVTFADQIVSDNGGYSAAIAKNADSLMFKASAPIALGTSTYTRSKSGTVFFYDNSSGDGTYYNIGTGYTIDSETGLLKITGGTTCNTGSDCKALAPTSADSDPKYMINQSYATASEAKNATSSIIYRLNMYHPSQMGALYDGTITIKTPIYSISTSDLQSFTFYNNNYYYVSSNFSQDLGEFTLASPSERAYSEVSNLTSNKYFATSKTSGNSASTTYSKIYLLKSAPTKSGAYYVADVVEYKAEGYTASATYDGLYATCVNYKAGSKTECDDDGYTYYFRGKVNNNWVKFADRYWRIVRVNENGTVRLIYAGPDAPSSSAKYNGSSETIFSSYDATLANNIEFTGTDLYDTVKDFYESNLTSFNSYISNEIFVSHAAGIPLSNYQASSTGGDGYNKTQIAMKNKYGTTIYYGNGLLDYSIGLLSVTEAQMAGIGYDAQFQNNYSNWLYTPGGTWLMANYVNNELKSKAFINDEGLLETGDNTENGIISVRPVINLVSNVTYTGSGTYNDPYVITGLS